MGFSSPKKPLDLADFLSRKGTPRRSRYVYTARTVPEPDSVDDSDADSDADTISGVKSGGTDGADR